MTLYSGRCVGGPYHGKPAHHGELKMMVAVLAARPSKVISLAPLAPPPEGVLKGYYAYDEAEGIWIWYLPQ